MDLTKMALHQHFGDAGGEAEVSIDLEGRVGVEKIRIDTAAAAVTDAVELAYGTL